LIERAPSDVTTEKSFPALFQFVRRLKAKDWAGAGPLALATPTSKELAGLLLSVIIEIVQVTPDCLEVLSTQASAAIFEHVANQLIEICRLACGTNALQATRLLHILGKIILLINY
jgi:hypothetical protein